MLVFCVFQRIVKIEPIEQCQQEGIEAEMRGKLRITLHSKLQVQLRRAGQGGWRDPCGCSSRGLRERRGARRLETGKRSHFLNGEKNRTRKRLSHGLLSGDEAGASHCWHLFSSVRCGWISAGVGPLISVSLRSRAKVRAPLGPSLGPWPFLGASGPSFPWECIWVICSHSAEWDPSTTLPMDSSLCLPPYHFVHPAPRWGTVLFCFLL